MSVQCNGMSVLLWEDARQSVSMSRVSLYIPIRVGQSVMMTNATDGSSGSPMIGYQAG